MASNDVPDPALKASPDMQAVLATLSELGAKPLESLTPADARRQPTLADAQRRLLQKRGATLDDRGVSRRNITFPGAAGDLAARVYMPERLPAASPALLYFHDGGFVVGDLEAADRAAYALAGKAQIVVVSATYRLGPEHKFPAAHDDAFAAYQWFVKNAASLGADPPRLAVGGEGAGGNLAANVVLKARVSPVPSPIYQLLVHPIAGTDMTSYSYRAYENARPVGMATMKWFFGHAATAADLEDKRLNLGNFELEGLPPATVITAEIDPLMFEGRLLAHKLESADVPVHWQNYDGVTHGFFGLDGVLEAARAAQDFAAAELKEALRPRR